jgi:tetratricopeptide (TPR) repeat protein
VQESEVRSPKTSSFHIIRLQFRRNSCAQRLKSAFVSSESIAEKVEAHKCLANADLCGHDLVSIQGDDKGGALGSGYQPEAAEKALKHLNAALKLAPQDLSIHQGRLHILEATGRYQYMLNALDESCDLYHGKDGLEAWLAYSSELADLGQVEYGLQFMRVLERHFPNSPDVIANIGAFLSMQGKSAEAIPYLEKAATLAPNDPIHAWDLGRAYDRENQIALADRWYKKGLALESALASQDPSHSEQLRDAPCLYAKFVEEKLHDQPRACSLEKTNCVSDEQPPARQNRFGGQAETRLLTVTASKASHERL